MTFLRWTARAMGVSAAWLVADGARRWAECVVELELEGDVPSPWDCANERFVRPYKAETADQAAWSWQARMLWPWLLVKADDAGVIATRTGPQGLAALTRLPIEHVEHGVADLLADGCVVEWASPAGYRIRNYIDAQNTPSSGNRRVAEHRARERVKRDVTPSNAEQRDETKSNPEPIRTDPNREEIPRAKPAARTRQVKTLLPDDWTAGPELAAVAREQGADLAVEMAKMRDWAAANAVKKADWTATARNWLRNANSRRPGPGLFSSTRPPEPPRSYRKL